MTDAREGEDTPRPPSARSTEDLLARISDQLDELLDRVPRKPTSNDRLVDGT